jgi:hypothetical protein
MRTEEIWGLKKYGDRRYMRIEGVGLALWSWYCGFGVV